MTKVNSDIFEIANQASLKILVDEKIVDIKHKFRLTDKSILGVLFFLIGGFFISIIPFIKTSEMTSKILGIVIGQFLVLLSLLTLIRQVSDRLTISDGIVTFRHNLKGTKIPLRSDMKIKMKTEIMKIRRPGTLGSDFIIVTHYLQSPKNNIALLKFQMDNRNSEKAIKLGNEITHAVNEKIRQLN